MKELMLLLYVAAIAPALASDMDPAREKLALGLEKALSCQKSDIATGADDALNIAGVIVQRSVDPYYNSFRYSFREPLAVNQLPLYSVQQSVGEGGVVLLAEISGEVQAFADQLAAHPIGKNDDVLGVSGVMFLKTVAVGSGAEDEANSSKIVIGQNAVQRAQGRFFYGCIQAMTL